MISERLSGSSDQVRLFRRNFSELPSVLAELGITWVHGILADLGVSSSQLEDAARGFSFMEDGPLDMRLDDRLPRTASDLVNALTERELSDLFWYNSQERFSRRIAKRICQIRRDGRVREERLRRDGGRWGGVLADGTDDVDGVSVSVDVTNLGPVAGKETVQLYVHDRASSLPRPLKELKGFAKVELQPGETKSVTIPLDFRAFAFYHPGFGQWITEDGEFDLLIGASSTDIRCTLTVTLESTLALPSLLTTFSTPRQWLADKRGKVIFAPYFQQLLGELAATFGVEAEGLSPDAMGYLLDMPLGDVLDFQGDALPAAPRVIVEGLLAQVRG